MTTRFFWVRGRHRGRLTVAEYDPIVPDGHRWHIVGDEVPYSEESVRDHYEILSEIPRLDEVAS